MDTPEGVFGVFTCVSGTKLKIFLMIAVGGSVASGQDLKSEVASLKSHSPWFNSSVMLVNCQLVCLLPVGICNRIMLI